VRRLRWKVQVVTAVERYAGDPMAFRMEQLLLDARGRRLGDVTEAWQIESIFRPLDDRQADGRYRYRLAYLELPRGHAKTTMIAAEAVTELVYADPDWRGHIAAGDKDQARELFDAVVGFIRRNPMPPSWSWTGSSAVTPAPRCASIRRTLRRRTACAWTGLPSMSSGISRAEISGTRSTPPSSNSLTGGA
jgi:hypothetical protein